MRLRDIWALVELIMMFVCRIVVRAQWGARLMFDKLQFDVSFDRADYLMSANRSLRLSQRQTKVYRTSPLES